MKIKAISKIEKKIQAVKALKYNSNYDLKESKDIIDWLNENQNQYKNIEVNDSRKFKKELKELDIHNFDFFINERNINFLKLGIGSKEEYIENLSDYIYSLSQDEIKDLISILDKNTLTKLIEKVKF